MRGTSPTPRSPRSRRCATRCRAWSKAPASWDAYPLTFSHTNTDDIFYDAQIGAGTYAPGDAIEHYLQIPYSDHDTTFVHGSDGQ